MYKIIQLQILIACLHPNDCKLSQYFFQFETGLERNSTKEFVAHLHISVFLNDMHRAQHMHLFLKAYTVI